MNDKSLENGLGQLLNLGLKSFTSDSMGNNIANLIKSSMENDLWKPAIDIIDTTNHIIIYVEIPSVNKQSIQLEFLNNQLTIYGEKVKKYSGLPTQGEILYGKFGKVINLPVGVTTNNNVSTKTEDGILEIKLTKLAEQLNKFCIKVEENK